MSFGDPIQLYHGKAYAGMLVDGQLHNTVSRKNKGTTVLPTATCVEQDGADCVKEFVSKPLGIVLRELNNATPDGGQIGIQPNRVGTIVTEGVVVVKAGEAVDYGDDVFIGTGTDVKGMFTKQAGSDTTLAVKWEGVKFVSKAGKKGDLVNIAIKVGA